MQRLDRINKLLDDALIAARNDNVKHAAVAHVVQVAEGRPQTEADLLQLEAELRKLTHYAVHRRDPPRIETKLDAKPRRPETGRMRNANTPYRRRTVETEEWYGQPPPDELAGPGPPVPTLVGDDDLGDPEDDDLDEPDEGYDDLEDDEE